MGHAAMLDHATDKPTGCAGMTAVGVWFDPARLAPPPPSRLQAAPQSEDGVYVVTDADPGRGEQ